LIRTMASRRDNKTAGTVGVWAIPVQAATIAVAELGPHRKVSIIVTCSRELVKRAGATAVFGMLLADQAALALDSALFNADPADDDRPAGLLHDVTPLDTGGLVGLAEVLTLLAKNLVEAGGSGPIAIATTPALALAIEINLPHLRWPVFPSLVIPEGTVTAIDLPSLVFAAGSDVDIESTNAATLHMNDAPTAITTEGDPNAAPVRGFWQTDSLATRLIADIAFAVRAPGRVQMVENQSWLQ